jgi:hypothetical protein
MNERTWAELLNEAMTIGQTATMAEIYHRVTRGNHPMAHTFLRSNDMLVPLQWAAKTECVTFERSPKNDGYSKWTRNRELIPPDPPKKDTNRVTVIKRSLPINSIAEAAENRITMVASPWEENT